MYNLCSKFVKYKLKISLIKVAGIAFKDQVDLISIMTPLEVVANIINVLIVLDTYTVCLFPLLYIFENLSFILCLNGLILFVDSKSEDRLFHILGHKLDGHF